MKRIGVLRRRRKPDEVASARVSIRNHCLECVSYVAREVELCTAPECWLYPWRLGKTPAQLRGRMGRSAGSRTGHSFSRTTGKDSVPNPEEQAPDPSVRVPGQGREGEGKHGSE